MINSNILAILATIAGSAMALSQVFQVIKIFRRKSALDISKPTYIILTLGSLIWLGYGIEINNFPIIISNGIGALTTMTVLVGCFLYGNKKV